MGHEHHGGAGLAPDIEQQILHFHAGELVERPERLVHQQQFRLVDQRAAERHALLHAAGQLRRVGLFEAFEADEGEQLFRRELCRGVAAAEDLHREQDIGEHGPPRHQISLLEDDAEIRLRFFDVAAVDLDRAARRRHQPADDLEKGRLAAAARAQQRHQPAGREVEGDILDRDQRRPPGLGEGLMDILEVPEWKGAGTCRGSVVRILERRRRHQGITGVAGRNPLA